LAWYHEAKFGLFIHWGSYSAGGVEASWPIMAPALSEAMFRVASDITEQDYTALAQRFNPVSFKPADWVRGAADAGMRYIVITAKHHDGFCMFDAPGTDYKVTNSPYGKDICLELADECAKIGMPLGFYYSPPDMHHPGYRDTSKPITANWTGEPGRPEWESYLDYMESHIVKLLSDYGKVSILWFDGLANHGKYNPERFHRIIKILSPDTLVNDRLGEGFDFVTPEQFIPKKGIPTRSSKMPSGMDPGGDSFFRMVNSMFKYPILKSIIRKQMNKYNDGELELSPVYQEICPAPERFQPWETCMTIGSTWAYNPNEKSWKEPRDLIRTLIETAAKGGNFLLNAGPSGTGTFQPEILDRLEAIGKWLKKYGEAVYGSTYTPIPVQTWGRSVRKNNKIHFFVFEQPEDGELRIEGLPGNVNSVGLFDGGNLGFKMENSSLIIRLPKAQPDPDFTVLTSDISGFEKQWDSWSVPAEDIPSSGLYARRKAISCAWINSLLNGIIAFTAYAGYDRFSFGQIAVDALITTGIISFINAWLIIDASGKDFFMKRILVSERSLKRLRMPKNSLLKTLLITIAVSAIIGGGLVSGFVYLFRPEGMNSTAYAALKTLYTGLCAALTAALAVRSSEPATYQR